MIYYYLVNTVNLQVAGSQAVTGLTGIKRMPDNTTFPAWSLDASRRTPTTGAGEEFK